MPINLGISPVCPESALSAYICWFRRATSEDSDQSVRMSRLTLVFTRIGFCHIMAQIWCVAIVKVVLISPFKPNVLSYLVRCTSLFQILGVFGDSFRFYSNSNRTLCEQTVETLIRRRVLRRLIWVCAVCLCPTKRTLGLFGLTE